jgi:hypothetical protein
MGQGVDDRPRLLSLASHMHDIGEEIERERESEREQERESEMASGKEEN